MKRGLSTGSLACCAGVAVVMMASAEASDRAVEVGKGVDVPGVWRPDQHLYVKGRLGIPAGNLDALEQWLDKNAPNWTVVLLANGQGEKFTDAGTRRFTGMDAVEHALGKTLPNKTAFGELKHPQTGEANGAYFLLFLQERKLSYFASDVYDKRNLGEDRWMGNLDSAAIRAMRGGGRVIDAAKDTITSIDRQLARKLAAAAADRKRAAERAARMRDEAAALIVAAESEVGIAANRATELARELGSPGGDLVRPAVIEWNGTLKGARQLQESGDSGGAGTSAQAVRDTVAAYLSTLDAHSTAPARIAALQKRIEESTLHEESTLGRTRLDIAKTRLEAAQDAHSAAESIYRQHLTEADDHLAEAVAASRFTESLVARLAQLQTEVESTAVHPKSEAARDQLAAAEVSLTAARTALAEGEHDFSGHLDAARQHLDASLRLSGETTQSIERNRAIGMTGGGVGGAAALLIGFIGNRRRREERAEAEKLLGTWDRALKEKLDGLFALLDRASVSVGSAADLDERGYSGETRRLGEQTIKDVDELFIMSSCVDGIFDRARALIEPGSLPARSVNLVSASRYLRAVRLLRDEPVRFEAGDQLEAIIKGKRAEWAGLLGKKDDYEPFAMSFEELVAAYDERAERALATLDILDGSWETISDRLEGLQDSIEEAGTAQAGTQRAAASDRLFALPLLFEKLLPAAQEQYDRSVKMGASDPVQALRGPIADGERMADDALALIGLVDSARKDLFPQLQDDCTQLQAAGRKAQWIGATLADESHRADALAQEATATGVGDRIEALEGALAALGTAAKEALELESRATKTIAPAIEEAERITVEARRVMGAALQLDPEEVLRETDRDPSELLRTARDEVAAGRAGLDRGAVLAARSAFDEAHDLTNDATWLVAESQRIRREFGANSSRADHELTRLERELPKTVQEANRLAANFAGPALKLAAGLPENDAPGTVADALQSAQTEWDAARGNLAEARRAHDAARLLEAAELLDRSEERARISNACLEDIHAHATRLAETGEANQSRFRSLEERTTTCEGLAAEFHATEKSRAGFAQLRKMLEELRLPAAGAGLDDPFTTREALNQAAEGLDHFEASVAANKLLLAEAHRSADAAAKELQTARRLARRTRTDNVPDSAQASHGSRGITDLEPQLEEVRRSLGVAHGNWAQLDAEADRIAGDASRYAATLRGELRRAEAAVVALTAASKETRRAAGWMGSLGIAIPGSPGASQLARARDLLNAGDYLAANRAADDSRRAARRAIDHAESEVRRKRRAARARQQSSNFGFSSSSRSSSFGSSSSFGGSSSGSSRSSFSSGSGTSRSGW